MSFPKYSWSPWKTQSRELLEVEMRWSREWKGEDAVCSVLLLSSTGVSGSAPVQRGYPMVNPAQLGVWSFLALPGKSLVLLFESGSNELMNVLDFRQDPDQIVTCHFCWPVVDEGVRGCLQAKQRQLIHEGEFGKGRNKSCRWSGQ